jgi:hypothetical protein
MPLDFGAIEDIAKIQGHAELTAADGHVFLGKRAPHLAAAVERSVQDELKVVFAFSRVTAVVEVALVGEGAGKGRFGHGFLS